MKELINIKKETAFKYLNLYTLTYKDQEKIYDYYIASRRDEKDLACKGSEKVDAVRVIPYFKKDGKTYVVLIHEFRHSIAGYMYSVPAGLVDEGESELESAIREVQEETGAKVKKIRRTEKASYTSAGLTDERITCFEAEVELGGNQKLDDIEDIRTKVVELDQLEEFLDNNLFGTQSALQLRSFIYKQKLEEYQNER